MFFLFFPVLLLSASAWGEDTPDVRAIVEKVDRLYRSDTSRGKVEMTIVSEHWERTLGMEVWSEGMDKTLIHITHPKKDAGISTLRIKNEMWNYFPKINKVMKVPPSMMMSSWMGSDFTNDDLVKESSMLEDYTFRLIDTGDADAGIYHVELLPKKDIPIVWGRIILTVRKDDFTPVRQEYFDEKGTKVRVMEFKEKKRFGGRSIPSVLELKPLNKESKTVIRYLDLEFDIALGQDIFTLRNLQRAR